MTVHSLPAKAGDLFSVTVHRKLELPIPVISQGNHDFENLSMLDIEREDN